MMSRIKQGKMWAVNMSKHRPRIEEHRACKRNETKHLVITVDFTYMM